MPVRRQVQKLPQPLLSVNSIKLGRFIISSRRPFHDYFDPTCDSLSAYTLETQQMQLTHVEQNVHDRSQSFNIGGTADLAHTNERSDARGFDTDSSTVYQLNNCGQWFRVAMEDQKTRDWIEHAVKTYGKIYLIVGYQTVSDAHIKEAVKEDKSFAGKLNAPLGMGLAAAGIVVPVGGLIDPGVGARSRSGQLSQREFDAPGQQVVAVEYCRVRFKWYSSKNIDMAVLDKVTTWKWNWNLRGQDVGINDIGEAELEQDIHEISDDSSDATDGNDDESI